MGQTILCKSYVKYKIIFTKLIWEIGIFFLHSFLGETIITYVWKSFTGG